MRVQQLIEALQALPAYQKELDVRVVGDSPAVGVVDVAIVGVDYCNSNGTFVGIKAPDWFPDEDDAFVDEGD